MSIGRKGHLEHDAEHLNRSVETKRQRKLLKCDRCPPHRGCNLKRKPRRCSK